MVKKLNDGVGKKIVEALKQQTGASEQSEILNTEEQIPSATEAINSAIEDVFESNDDFELQQNGPEDISFDDINLNNNFNFDTNPLNDMDSDFMSSPIEMEQTKQAYEPKDITLPANIIILQKLISQLPNGVSHHTGALIIKQTMEALGISMKSVLREAQEVQESLKKSSKECQLNIQDYKKQISILEKRVQSYQKQYNSLNDLISLFIQTN